LQCRSQSSMRDPASWLLAALTSAMPGGVVTSVRNISQPDLT